MSREKHARVLVVDDNKDAADSMAMLLELWGYASKTCYGWAEALETALAYRPQIVLLDVGMPVMDGFEIAVRLRGQPGFAGATIIGISGYANECYRRRALAQGFDHYLAKPVELEYLQELLRGFALEVEAATRARERQPLKDVSAARSPPPIDSPHFVSGNLLSHFCFLRQEECGSRPVFAPNRL
jgi:CheY-like chemotaxis protein